VNDVRSESPDRVSDCVPTRQEAACTCLPHNDDLDRPLEDCTYRAHLAGYEDPPRQIDLRGIKVRDE